jgi:hypothetical protein
MTPTNAQIIAVVLAVLIAIVPLWYPRYSIFYRRGLDGVEKLKRLDEYEVFTKEEREIEQDLGILEPDDLGFREVSRTIEMRSNVHGNIAKIILIREVRGNGSGIGFGSGGVRSLTQAALQVEFESGRSQQVIEPNRIETEQILQLEQLQEWIKIRAERRSHYWTTILAVLWGAVSTISTI